jgi:hypothetical protein
MGVTQQKKNKNPFQSAGKGKCPCPHNSPDFRPWGISQGIRLFDKRPRSYIFLQGVRNGSADGIRHTCDGAAQVAAGAKAEEKKVSFTQEGVF